MKYFSHSNLIFSNQNPNFIPTSKKFHPLSLILISFLQLFFILLVHIFFFFSPHFYIFYHICIVIYFFQSSPMLFKPTHPLEGKSHHPIQSQKCLIQNLNHIKVLETSFKSNLNQSLHCSWDISIELSINQID